MFVFLILAAVMIIGAVGVITLKQPVHAALSLVATLLTLAITYVTLEAHFLAATQVIVYAGAIMVLFLFVIMLLNVQEDDEEAGLGWIRPAAYAIGVAAAAGIAITAFRNPSQMPDAAVVSAALQGGGAGPIADALFSEFVLAFQLVGVLLLTGIIGATSLVQRKAVAVYGSPEAKLKVPASTASGAGGVAVLERPEESPQAASSHIIESKVVAPEVKEETDTSVDEETLLEELSAEETVADSNEIASDVDTSETEESESISTEVEATKTEAEPKDLTSETRTEIITDGSVKDDLKRIKGVGPVLEKLLHSNGVYTFAQIAAFAKEDIETLDEKLEGFHGRIERDDWVKQAKELAAEKE